MLAEEDKVVCPACAADSEGSGQSATYYERADQVRPWRRDESRIEVKGLYDHYVARWVPFALIVTASLAIMRAGSRSLRLPLAPVIITADIF